MPGMVRRDDRGPRGLKALFLSSDIFLPLRYEPFGTVFAEAMLHGPPCVGFRAYGDSISNFVRGNVGLTQPTQRDKYPATFKAERSRVYDLRCAMSKWATRGSLLAVTNRLDARPRQSAADAD